MRNEFLSSFSSFRDDLKEGVGKRIVTNEDAVLEGVGCADDAGSELRHGCV
jgi:hypothetical protein